MHVQALHISWSCVATLRELRMPPTPTSADLPAMPGLCFALPPTGPHAARPTAHSQRAFGLQGSLTSEAPVGTRASAGACLGQPVLRMPAAMPLIDMSSASRSSRSSSCHDTTSLRTAAQQPASRSGQPSAVYLRSRTSCQRQGKNKSTHGAARAPPTRSDRCESFGESAPAAQRASAVRIYIHIYISIYISIYIYIHLYPYTYTHTHTHMHAYMHTYTHT